MFTIDFNKKYLPFSEPPVSFIINESGFTEVGILNVDTLGATGVVKFSDPDGETFAPSPITFKDQSITFSVPTSKTGIWGLIVEIYTKNNGTVKSAKFGYPVYEGIDAGDQVAKTYVSLFDTMTKAFAEWQLDMADYNATNETGKTTIQLMENALTAVNNALASGTVDLELKTARTDTKGVTHANLKVRLDSDFNDLASRIPSNIAVNGYESVTTNDTLSGEMSSAVLSGNTLVNEIDTKNTSLNYYQNMRFSYSNGEIQLSFVDNAYPSFGSSAVRNLKSNTTYTVVFDFKGEVVEGRSYRTGISRRNGSSAWNTNAYAFVPNTSYTTHVFKTTTGELTPEIERYGFAFSTRLTDGTGLTDKMWFKNILILEGDHTDKPLEFFEGLKSAEVAEIGTHGVNLVDVYAMHKNWTSKEPTYAKLVNIDGVDHISVFDGHALYNNGFKIKVTKGTTYRIKTTVIWETSGNTTAVSVRNGDDIIFINGLTNNADRTATFVAKGDYIEFVSSYNTSSKYFILKNLTLYEVTPNTPTEYIPYTSSTVTLPSPIKLRSLPNGISDTYDVDTGVLTRRCGEVVLNGSESGWQEVSVHPFNSGLLVVNGDLYPLFNNGQIGNYNYKNNISNHFNSGVYQEIIDKDRGEVFGFSSRYVRLAITKSRLTTPDVAGFKAWLTANPTTVVYQLATPTTEVINHDGYLRSYDNQTTITADSVVPADLKATIKVDYGSTLQTTMKANEALKQENELIKTELSEVRNEINAVHTFLYRMLSVNTLEEPEVIE